MKNARNICVYQKKAVLLRAFSCKEHVIIINPGTDSCNPTPTKNKNNKWQQRFVWLHGHKDYAFYHIVVADSRSPRDGKIIERIGSFNPNTNPAAVILNFDRALYWVGVGAQPTDTVRTILSNEGVMLMKHLNGGVAKGAFSAEEAQKRFDAWKAQKDAKNGKISAAEADKKAAAAKALLAQEVETNKAKAAAIAQKRAEAAAELAAAAQEAAQEAAAAEAEANGEEAPAEEPAAEEAEA